MKKKYVMFWWMLKGPVLIFLVLHPLVLKKGAYNKGNGTDAGQDHLSA